MRDSTPAYFPYFPLKPRSPKPGFFSSDGLRHLAYSSVAGEYFGDSVLILSWQLWDFHSD